MKMINPAQVSGRAVALLFLITLFVGPAVTGHGQIFVSIPNGEGSGLIQDFTTEGTSATFASSLDKPEGLAFWGGDLYVALNTNGSSAARVVKFDTEGNRSDFIANTGSLSTLGLVFDSSGNLYAANTGTSKIAKFSADGSALSSITTTAGAYGLAIDGDGNLYAALRDTDTIVSYNSSGDLNWSKPAGDGPFGVAVYGSTLFVSSSAADSIDMYSTSDGSSLGNYADAEDGLSGPYGLAVDSAGNLYVANNGGSSIEVFSAAHTYTSFAAGGNPAFVLAAVPEPSTWTVLAGIGAIGFALWSRRLRRAHVS